jgi:hypothetical protein
MKHLSKFNESISISKNEIRKYLDDYFLEIYEKCEQFEEEDDDWFIVRNPIVKDGIIHTEYLFMFDIDTNLNSSTLDNTISLLSDIKNTIKRIESNNITVKYRYSNGDGYHIFNIEIPLSLYEIH